MPCAWCRCVTSWPARRGLISPSIGSTRRSASSCIGRASSTRRWALLDPRSRFAARARRGRTALAHHLAPAAAYSRRRELHHHGSPAHGRPRHRACRVPDTPDPRHGRAVHSGPHRPSQRRDSADAADAAGRDRGVRPAHALALRRRARWRLCNIGPRHQPRGLALRGRHDGCLRHRLAQGRRGHARRARRLRACRGVGRRRGVCHDGSIARLRRRLLRQLHDPARLCGDGWRCRARRVAALSPRLESLVVAAGGRRRRRRRSPGRRRADLPSLFGRSPGGDGAAGARAVAEERQ